MTGLVAPPTRLWSEPVRPAPLDGRLPDVHVDFGGEFVVDWQVVERPDTASAPAEAFPLGILLP